MSREVADVLEVVEESGLEYRVSAMSTLVEGEWDELLTLLEECYEAARESAPRALMDVRFDDKAGEGLIEGKVESVERQLGRSLRR